MPGRLPQVRQAAWSVHKSDIMCLITKGYFICIDKLAMVASAVSSKMIEAMAVKEGFKFEECLTGELSG